MPLYGYKHKGSADEFTPGIVEADSPEAAVKKLDEVYGVERDDAGQPTNTKFISVVMITKDEFETLEQTHGKEQTHRIKA